MSENKKKHQPIPRMPILCMQPPSKVWRRSVPIFRKKPKVETWRKAYFEMWSPNMWPLIETILDRFHVQQCFQVASIFILNLYVYVSRRLLFLATLAVLRYSKAKGIQTRVKVTNLFFLPCYFTIID